MTRHEAYVTLQRNLINGGCSPEEASRLISAYDDASLSEMAKQVSEIHEMLSAFRNGVEAMMNNPMLSAMLPPQVRGLL